MKGQKKSKPDKRLPSRLFATDRFPTGRHNIFSKPDILPFIQNVLKDTDELQYIKNSSFGGLFDLPARQCPVSCKLIHAFLTRQLLCEDRHTLWSVFGSDAVRFGLQEFGTITGLPCGDFPADYEIELEDQSKANSDPDWIRLLGKKKFVTIADLRHRLESDIRMPRRKKLQIALILIVDGVLIAHQQKTRPTLKYVKMVQDVDAFCQHPWGRESFLKTINCMKPPLDCEDPAEPHLPVHANINYNDILRVEAEQDLAVTSLIPIRMQPQHEWGVWPEAAVDARVTYMESLISNNHLFKKHLWPGGFRGCPKLMYKPPKEQPEPRRHVLKPTKTIIKPSSSRKQRRISNYFSRTASNPSNTNDQIIGLLTTVSSQVSKLRKDFKAMRQLIKRRKTRSHSTRTAFHTVISSDCKANLESRGCQTENEEQTTEAKAPTTESPTPMEEDPTHCNSPVISQYGAQQYGIREHRSPVHMNLAHTDLEPMDTEHNLPEHKSPAHTDSEPKVTDLRLLVHNSPEPTTSFPPVPEGTTPVKSLPLAASPSATPPWLYTPESPPVIYKSEIYTAADHPNSPALHHLLNEDTSTRRDDQPPPHPITPDTSPTKSSGFEEHAATVNAFAATATSRRISIPKLNFDQSQEDNATDDCTELSDSSPARPTPMHQPSEEEALLAAELFNCTSVPAICLVPPPPRDDVGTIRLHSPNKTACVAHHSL
ncbi:ULP_PROTEASE domain-containing protein [Raphanus sativus]|nr:ULP_PROTEASE domain-containing protein [Raphanus sativus]